MKDLGLHFCFSVGLCMTDSLQLCVLCCTLSDSRQLLVLYYFYLSAVLLLVAVPLCGEAIDPRVHHGFVSDEVSFTARGISHTASFHSGTVNQ